MSSKGTTSATLAVDKTTLQPIEATYFGFLTFDLSYNYSVKRYPLSVGKTWAVTMNGTTTGLNQTATKTFRYTYKVEKVESITVPAGTFQCFKVVQYNSSTNAVSDTLWVTDVTGGFTVKEIDNTSGTTQELVSYSLSK